MRVVVRQGFYCTDQSLLVNCTLYFPGGPVIATINGLRGFAKLKKFQKSKNNLEVGGWVQVPFG